MPDLDTTLHVDMLNGFKSKREQFRQLLRNLKRGFLYSKIYGLEWGDPEMVEPLTFIKNRYLRPYIDARKTALEIGPGGGRWTRYLMGFKKLYIVDYYDDLLRQVKRNFNKPHMTFIKNNGTDFPGVPPASIDFLFSFGTFVHLDEHLIRGYLKNMKSILKPGASVVIHYSDKTKIMAQVNDGFADTTPEKMREMILGEGYEVLEEDLTTMWHSSLVRFTYR